MNVTGWGLSFRLAWREVRRRPGRTVLVALLVLVPVMAMTAGDVLSRSLDDGYDFGQDWRPGTDIVVFESVAAHRTDLGDSVPAPAELTTVTRVRAVPVEADSGVIVEDLDIEDPGPANVMATPVITARGRLPAADGEVWLSSGVSDRLGLEIGETLTLRHPEGSWAVVGVGRVAEDFDLPMMVMRGLPVDDFRGNVVDVVTLIALGDDSPAAVETAGQRLQTLVGDRDAASVDYRGNVARSSRNADRLAGWVVGAIALAAVGVIVAAAFATSARRQLRSIGLLSANGAPEAVVRRSLALQGWWTGLIGSVLGVGLAVVGLAVARGPIVDARRASLPPYRYAPGDLVVIVLTGIIAATVAALVPAWTASRVPVMAALAGRRPLADVPKRMVPVGIAVFSLGVLMLAVAAATTKASGAAAIAAVVGGVAVMAGTSCCSPLVVDAMSRGAARIGRSWRFAGRSLGRTRSRSAAVVTAIAVAAGAASAGSVVALRADDSDPQFSGLLPSNVAELLPMRAGTIVPRGDAGEFDEVAPTTPWTDSAVDADQVAAVTAVVPGSEFVQRRIVQLALPASSNEDWAPALTLGIVVADEATMDVFELTTSERQALGTVGMIAAGRTQPDDAPDTAIATIPTAAGNLELPYAFRDVDGSLVMSGRVSSALDAPIFADDRYLISPDAAAAAGLKVIDNGGWLVAPHRLTNQLANDLLTTLAGSAAVLEVYRDVPTDTAGAWMVGTADLTTNWSPMILQAAIIAIALLLVLLVVAIGLALAAAESRDERDILVAVGAPPATMRSMAGVKAVVVTITGVALGIPAGLIPTYAVSRASGDPFEIPWISIAGLLVVIPLLAGTTATLASSIAQRVHPVRMSTLAAD